MTEAMTTFVTLRMPSGAVEKFKTAWLEDAAFIARQPGQKGGALYRRIGDDEHVEFVNVAHWENQDSLNAARAAALVEQHREGRDQASIFSELGVSVSAANYRVDFYY